MKRATPFLPVAIAIAVASGACTLDRPSPSVLEPTDQTLALIAVGSGVQVYECRERKDGYATAHEWSLLGPEATLYAGGRMIGTHGAGPSWQSTDGSRVVGGVMAKVNAPSGDSIPWLLLTTRSDGPEGAFSKVTSIQRVNTHGGLRPSNGCDDLTVGRQIPVRYTADYRFYVASP
jgi:hypothetical protein